MSAPKIYFLIVAALFISINTFTQTRVSGIIKDKHSGEILIGAGILEKHSKNGTISDNNGFFSIIVKNSDSIIISFIGYENYVLKIQKGRDTIVHIALNAGIELEEVLVESPFSPRFNVASLSRSEMLSIPSISGKPDIIKALTLLPGIQSQNEGSSMMLVRGGDPGQNLYLLDNIPIIYVNHLGGLMSVFNPEMINNVDIYKGAFPARYGDKLSSVVDITQREGNNTSFKGSASIGITDASFSLEGPTKIKNTSYLITGRKTLFEPLFILPQKIIGNNSVLLYGFHDFNGKFTWKKNDRNSFYFNLYQGDDYMYLWTNKNADFKTNDLNNKTLNIWGNWMASARWNSMISSRLYASNSISYTRYRLRTKGSSTSNDTSFVDNNSKSLSSIDDISLRSTFKYKLNGKWSIEYGQQSSVLRHIPNYSFISTMKTQYKTDTIIAIQPSIFIDNTIRLFGRTEIHAGCRFVSYFTKDFSDWMPEPRISLNIGVNRSHTLNISAMKISQYSHLMFTPGSVMNNEIWVPADKSIDPAQAIQYSGGWIFQHHNHTFQTELNAYYKKLSNLSTYREGFHNLIGDGQWQSKIESGGTGIAKGIELLIRKNTGKWTGFASYTLSSATRQYPNINMGKEYVFEFDRPHSFSITLSHAINSKLSLSMAWVYQTGLPYTPVIGRQYVPTDLSAESVHEEYIYGARNSDRMKDYHRLDVAMNYNKLSKKRKLKTVWTFSIYNLYNRHNPYYYYYNVDKSDQIWPSESLTGDNFKPLQLYQFSLFPIIPSVSYRVYFDQNSFKKKDADKIPFKQKFEKWFFFE